MELQGPLLSPIPSYKILLSLEGVFLDPSIESLDDKSNADVSFASSNNLDSNLLSGN